MKADLDAVASILAKWSVRINTDPKAVALMSFWAEASDQHR
jgi:hypothetical protein